MGKEEAMAISVFDHRTIPRKVKGSGKQVLFDSPQYHVWIHGPDAPGDKGPMHNHTADETFYCVQGEGRFHFTSRESVTLTPGMMIVIPKGDYYQIEATGKEEMVLFGTRAEPFAEPRFTTDGKVVDDKTRFDAGANY
jgi:mannose-6-phosphate isomerase-like protein (cupin superfamily)